MFPTMHAFPLMEDQISLSPAAKESFKTWVPPADLRKDTAHCFVFVSNYGEGNWMEGIWMFSFFSHASFCYNGYCVTPNFRQQYFFRHASMLYGNKTSFILFFIVSRFLHSATWCIISVHILNVIAFQFMSWNNYFFSVIIYFGEINYFRANIFWIYSFQNISF